MNGSTARAGLVLAAAAIASPAAWAWGVEGHKVVAKLADRQLTPAARRVVRRLLSVEPGQTLEDVANWADEDRTPDTAKWHYVNFPGDSCHYVAARDCPDGDCAIEALQTQYALLKDRGAAPRRRLTALKYVVHFVGDIHQPLHAGMAADHGGNGYQIQWGGRETNLHKLWDVQLPEFINPNWRGLERTLRPGPPEQDTALGDPVSWAEESCQIARRPGFYPDQLRRVTRKYIRRWSPLLKRRLQLAGWRLASMLNALHD